LTNIHRNSCCEDKWVNNSADSKNIAIFLDIFKKIPKDFAKASDSVIEIQDGEIINCNLIM